MMEYRRYTSDDTGRLADMGAEAHARRTIGFDVEQICSKWWAMAAAADERLNVRPPGTVARYSMRLSYLSTWRPGSRSFSQPPRSHQGDRGTQQQTVFDQIARLAQPQRLHAAHNGRSALSSASPQAIAPWAPVEGPRVG